MSSPFSQYADIFQKLKDIDLDKVAQIATKLDLKDLLDRISRLNENQVKKVVDFIHSLPQD